MLEEPNHQKPITIKEGGLRGFEYPKPFKSHRLLVVSFKILRGGDSGSGNFKLNFLKQERSWYISLGRNDYGIVFMI